MVDPHSATASAASPFRTTSWPRSPEVRPPPPLLPRLSWLAPRFRCCWAWASLFRGLEGGCMIEAPQLIRVFFISTRLVCVCVCVAPWAVVSCMRALGVPSIPELIYLRNLEVLNLDGNRLECAFPRRSSCSTLPVNNWSR
jgi:hypothetical protein